MLSKQWGYNPALPGFERNAIQVMLGGGGGAAVAAATVSTLLDWRQGLNMQACQPPIHKVPFARLQSVGLSVYHHTQPTLFYDSINVRIIIMQEPMRSEEVFP